LVFINWHYWHSFVVVFCRVWHSAIPRTSGRFSARRRKIGTIWHSLARFSVLILRGLSFFGQSMRTTEPTRTARPCGPMRTTGRMRTASTLRTAPARIGAVAVSRYLPTCCVCRLAAHHIGNLGKPGARRAASLARNMGTLGAHGAVTVRVLVHFSNLPSPSGSGQREGQIPAIIPHILTLVN
jgi:hypothetical protein